MIYFIPLLLILTGCYLYDYRKNQKGRLLLWIILLIIFICIPGFRYRMGGDTIQYERFYEMVHTLGNLRLEDFKATRYAPGYILLNSICKTITDDFMMLQFVVSTIVNSVIFYFFWKNTRHIYLALFLYSFLLYLNLNMEVLREALAVSVFLLSWPFFRDGKWLLYYCMCFLAFMFHLSAIFLFVLPLCCIPGIRFIFTFGMRTWLIGGLILVFGFIVNYFFFDFIKSLALAENIMERAETYSKLDIGGARSLNLMGFLSKFIKYILYTVLALYFLKKNYFDKRIEPESFEKKEILAVTSIYVSLASVSILILARYNNYLFCFCFILIADWVFSYLLINGKKIRLKFVEWLCIVLPLFFVSLFTFYLNPINKEGTLKTYMLYYPYKNSFTKETDPDREKVYKFRKKI